MIPLQLQLKNFLSYGPDLQTIDFAPYQLICLSGKNGHGKSALLDAITWALWGSARKTFGTAKADDGLVRLGQTQMMVIFDFMFNGHTYRIRREYAKTYGKPYAVLEFGVLNQETDTLIPLTDKTIRQTQAKIEQMLNLDAESFANSAFLRQGNANEFSKKTAKERKVILATILGLNRYDTVRVLALEKIRQASAQKATITLLHDTYRTDIEQKNTVTERIAQANTHLAALAIKEEAAFKAKQALDVQRQELAKRQKDYEVLTFKQAQYLQEQQEKLNSLKTTRHQWRTTHQKLLTLRNHEQLETERRKLLNEINEHQLALQKNLELRERHLATKEKAAKTEKQVRDAAAHALAAKQLHLERLAMEQTASTVKLTELEAVMAQRIREQQQYAQRITALRTQYEQGIQEQAKVVTLEKQFERRKEYYQKFVTQGTWIKQELDNLAQKQQLVHDDDNPSCPLCEQNLSATRKRFLKKRFSDDEIVLHKRIERLKKVTIALKALLIEQHTQLATLKKGVETTAALKAQVHEIEQQKKAHALALEQDQAKHEQLKTILAQHEHMLVAERAALELLIKQGEHDVMHNPELQKLLAAVTTLEHELQSNVYDAVAHKEAQLNVQRTEIALAEYAQLPAQQALQHERAQTLAQLCVHLKKLKKTLAENHAQLAAFASLHQHSIEISAQDKALELEQTTLRTEKDRLLQEKGKLEHEYAKIVQREAEWAQQRIVLQQLDAQIDDYQIIATATSKDGIQALLIEEAIPEIEQEANELLARLTNNTAQIFIESLRDLKKGGTKETLDIKISDTIGIRPYEMFSGGEAFRIDFALRIAISKLLARRAGTSLQTLIIDEGFGALDEEGLGHIMDAIHKIQDDFAKIIIVSHLPFMKDQFPVHFLVEKGPNGSTVNVLEQG